MNGVFHGAESFNFFPVATFPDSVTILFQHPHIKSDIVSDDAVSLVEIVQKVINVAIDVIIGLKHGFTDAMHSLCKEIHLGRDVDILIDSRFFVKFFSIPDSVDSSKLNNLISRGETGRFCIDKEQSDPARFYCGAGSFCLFRRSFLSGRFFLEHRIL